MLSFRRYSLLVLAYNLIVILWGVFLRASRSGDGCGQHWLTCHGEIIPSAPELKTLIEFSHRVTSAIAFLLVLGLLIWAFRKYDKGNAIRRTSLGAFVFIITEALIGAGLVLTGNTAENLTPTRPLWMAGHLLNTFILIAFLTLTVWLAYGREMFSLKVETKFIVMILIAIFGILFISITGSIAALSNLIFPSESIAEGIAKDFSSTSHLLVRLRVSHPIASILVSVYLIFFADLLKNAKPSEVVSFWAKSLSILIIAQLVSGAITLLTLSPILMQVMHLLLADLVWINFLLLVISFLEKENLSRTQKTTTETITVFKP
ncbi:MAG: COX15/CtaA family protein [Pyrinomonadaceae bacterium]|nr:COX15/CtaA family protein [Pyrinomonadaceae bacterium]MCX7640701.1 COX15/CtaA family protein [Pyrinomonadaceae bacterium]MDW8305405.1 COX15/CtaA family protein [Acidobacteriota bacterium]